MDSQEGKSLEQHFSNRSRKAKRIGKRLLVPKVFDDQGTLLPSEKLGQIKYVWDFNLKEARLLKALQDTNGNFDQAIAQTEVEPEWAKKFLKTKDAVTYLAESGHLAALATVADRNYVIGRLVRAANGQEKPTEEERWGIDRLKDIIIPKQLANLKVENNVFQFPTFSPEIAAQLKELADKAADIQETSIVQP